ncbi:OsmC family protein [Musicola keenii]|uniref:OsmC family protein n=1 Tax=Musicola keenii TaxID=2884250 RepID=UPI001786353D|nr:OsmC family protein [Musicola keenii]
MKGEHRYAVKVTWEGNVGAGTEDYRAYGRQHRISVPGKPDIPGSADPAFRGDAGRWNPEDLLVASLSACHKLWYLHLCATSGISVLAYEDEALGVMQEDAARGGYFSSVTLRPVVTVRDGDDLALALTLHEQAHHLCFIANSVNFPVSCEPQARYAA